MRICSWTTKNHNSRCQLGGKRHHESYVPGSSTRETGHSDDVVMTLIRRVLDGEQMKAVARELGVGYALAGRWVRGESKYPLLSRVLKERGE